MRLFLAAKYCSNSGKYLPKVAHVLSYQAINASRSEFVVIHNRRYHLRRWGDPQAPLLIFLHGWMDFSGSHQFIVDELKQEWNIVAPDWAGYGLSEGRVGVSYMSEYLADLDAIIDLFSPDEPVSIVAHSMGGGVASMYAGARPERVKQLVNMEGFWPPAAKLESPSQSVATWLSFQRSDKGRSIYKSPELFAKKLMSANSLLPLDRAMFLAEHFTRPLEGGARELLVEPASKALLPIYPHPEQLLEIWQQISAEVLFLRGSVSYVSVSVDTYPEELLARLQAVARGREVMFDGVSHNMHHEVPELIAEQIECFIKP